MTDLVPFLPGRDELATTVDLAARLADTSFVPRGLRGDRNAVLAAMLVGRELGIGAMESLRSVHVIEGKPTESAELLHALVLRAGHDLYVAESTRDRCVVRYRRRTWPADRPDAEVVWTMDDARAAGLAGKAVWNSYPRAMLRSRAVSEAARQGFPDVVKGAGFTGEELGDDDRAEVEAQATAEVLDVERVDPAPPAPSIVEEAAAAAEALEDDTARRRALWERARAAYARLVEEAPEVAPIAWRDALTGVPGVEHGSSAADVFRVGDLLVLEVRVGDLERAADDDGSGPAPAEPDDDGQDDDGDDAVDAELVDDDPEPCDVCGSTDDKHDGSQHGPDAFDAADGDAATADADLVAEAATAARTPAADEELEVEAWQATDPWLGRYRRTTTVEVLELLRTGSVRVSADDNQLLAIPSSLDRDARAVVIRDAEEEMFDPARRTVTAQVGRVAHVPSAPQGRQRPQDGRTAAPDPDAPAEPATAVSEPQDATPGRYGFVQPDGFDSRDYAERVALWRRVEDARARLTAGVENSDASEAERLELRKCLHAVDREVVAQVGTDPVGALWTDRAALEELVATAERIASSAVPF